MRRAVLLAFVLAARPALGDEAALIAFMGGQGCTIGADSRTAAAAAGHDAAAVDALAAAALADGRGKQEGAYVVLNEATCTIRLPDITSPYTVNSPEIVAITSAIDAYAPEGEPGCFIENLVDDFAALNGGDLDAGLRDFLAFTASGIIAGDLRFYSPSPLRTPISWQVVTGACAELQDIDAIRRSHAFIASGFGSYIRLLASETACPDGWNPRTMRFAAEIQGTDPAIPTEDQPEINAWLGFEYDLIAFAAGWHEDLTATSPGTPRPPLCHYP
ncbi:MAG: hypothetical protein WAS26_17940 [Paracoccaceae bacterium]